MSKDVELIMKSSDTLERRYLYLAESEESYESKYNYFQESIKAKRYSLGEYGTVSDCFILYMITLMGNSSREAIENMLRAYSNNYKTLSIAKNLVYSSGNTENMIESRIKVLLKNGIIFAHYYDVPQPDGSFAKVALYGIERDSQTFMNKRLGKQTVIRPWSYTVPFNEAIADAAAGYVASEVAVNSGCKLKSIKEDAFKTQEIGVQMLPPTLFLDGNSGEKYQVLFYPAFLNHVPTYQTESDFERWIKHKLDCIRNFLYIYANAQRKPYCVVVCESSMDLEKMRKVIQQITPLAKYLDSIYFTSEGAVRMISKIQNSFLRLEKMDDGELVYVKTTPPFIKSN